MQQNYYYFKFIRSLSVFAGCIGLLTLSLVPVRAQTSPGLDPSPGEVEQPETTPVPAVPPFEIEQPEIEQPEIEQEQPEIEQPGVEQPGIEQPGVEQPGVEQEQPGIEQEQPGIEQEQPGVEQPEMQQPGVEQPEGEQPGIEQEQPGVEQPEMQQPGVEQPEGEQPGTTSAPPADILSDSENQSPTELLQQVSAAGSFNTLAQAVEAAGLTDALQNSEDRYTIFAPTDEAFAALPQGTLEQLLRPENQELLRQLLSYHVVSNELLSSQLSTGAIDTLGGGIAVRVTPDRIVVNDGSVIRSDIQTANGVVHVINRVLMPNDLRQQIDSLQ